MNWGERAAVAMIFLSLAASLGYFCAGDYRRGLYWLCSAGLITTVTL